MAIENTVSSDFGSAILDCSEFSIADYNVYGIIHQTIKDQPFVYRKALKTGTFKNSEDPDKMPHYESEPFAGPYTISKKISLRLKL